MHYIRVVFKKSYRIVNQKSGAEFNLSMFLGTSKKSVRTPLYTLPAAVHLISRFLNCCHHTTNCPEMRFQSPCRHGNQPRERDAEFITFLNETTLSVVECITVRYYPMSLRIPIQVCFLIKGRSHID